MVDVSQSATLRSARSLVLDGAVPTGQGGVLTPETLSSMVKAGIVLDAAEFIELQRLILTLRVQYQQHAGSPDAHQSDLASHSPEGSTEPLCPNGTTPVTASQFLSKILLAYGVRSAFVIEGASTLLALGLACHSPEIEYVSATGDRDVDLARMLAPKSKLSVGEVQRPFDCYVVGFATELAGTKRSVSEHSHVVSAIMPKHLARNAKGLVVCLLPTSYLRPSRRRKLVSQLRESGLELSALLSMPAHTDTRGGGMLIGVISRSTAEGGLYVAEVPVSADQQRMLADRIVSRTAGADSCHGRVVEERTFSGMEYLDELDKLSRLAVRMGVTPNPCRAIFATVEHLVRDEAGSFRYPKDDVAVYVPFTGAPSAACALAAVDDSVRSVVRFSVRHEVANARYVALAVNGDLGIALREAVRAMRSTSKSSLDALLDTEIYLPSLAIQEASIEALDHVATLSAELSELESMIWKRPKDAHSTLQRVRAVNHHSTTEMWGESLPFPLSSILRYCAAEKGSPKEQCQILLWFFEATAAFLATVHLSAASRDPVRWSELKDSIDTQLARNSVRWASPCFSLWRTVNEVATSIVRPRLNGGSSEAESVRSLYCIHSPRGMSALTDSRVLSVLEEVSRLRNLWSGHGGAASDAEASERCAMLLRHLDTMRQGFGETFNRVQLIIPGDMRVKPGPSYECEVEIAEGSNPSFLKRRISFSEPPVSEGLHLLEDGSAKSLPLMGLVQIRRRAQPACYFFNRVDSSGTHFVSYHFTHEGRIVDEGKPSPALAAVLSTC
jgi:hypothetical protein